MELMLRAVKILRFKYCFNGYIHLKLMPSSSRELVEEAFKLADRVSSNLELPFLREYRLYQANWLLRFYGFKLEEVFEENKNLPLEIDPKLFWALRHLEIFPVDLAKVDYYELIRVPGIGPTSAKKIIQDRKYSELSKTTLKNRRC